MSERNSRQQQLISEARSVLETIETLERNQTDQLPSSISSTITGLRAYITAIETNPQILNHATNSQQTQRTAGTQNS